MIVENIAQPLVAAQFFRGLGFSVLPIPRPRPGVPAGVVGDGKVPALAWRELQERLPSDAELVRWFGGKPMNVGVVTGAISGIVVIDADSVDARRWCVGHLPRTPWQVQTSSGFHFYYQHPGGRVPNRARIQTHDGRLKLDVRSDGGFAVGPTSIHATGTIYGFAGDWSAPRDQVPRFLPTWTERPTRPTRGVRPLRPSGNLVQRARRYLTAIPTPEIGMGSDNATLYAACRLVRGFGLSSHDAELLIWDWAGGRAGWTREWVAKKVDSAIRYGTEAVGGLR